MSSRRATADERREAVLAAAVEEFAARGLHGASTETIAAAAGISHPYLFKLFGTKKELFLAASERVYERIHATFAIAADGEVDTAVMLAAMGKAYYELLERRAELRLLLHGFAAAGDPEIGAAVRHRYAALYRFVRDRTGADIAQMQAFWSHGMLLTIAAAIDLRSLAGEEDWVEQVLDYPL